MFNTRDDAINNQVIRTKYESFQVSPLTPHIGAEISNVPNQEGEHYSPLCQVTSPTCNQHRSDLFAWF